MKVLCKRQQEPCPVTVESVKLECQQAFTEVVNFCLSCESPFWLFEKRLLVLMATLGCGLVRLFLTARHERLDVEPYLQDGKYRRGKGYAARTLKTAYGTVSYGRTQLLKRTGGRGLFPLDLTLGLTRDRLSPWVMQFVAKLATRMSFKAAQLVCRAALRWSPATETIEQVVLGLGREAAPFMSQLAAPQEDGEVLVIEADGKCPPTATEEELRKRRGKRQQHPHGCACGCQRHRSKSKRQARGSKKRRKKGDKSKNGKEAMVIVMYTLRRGADGKLHGPINKKVWATFAGRQAAVGWARAEATKRGFPPGTAKTVQIVMDGALGLKEKFESQFAGAIITLDVIHVVEKLWDLGHRFHQEGSDELKAWVEDLKSLLYTGRVEELLERLRGYLKEVPMNGPGTKSRRQQLKTLIGYVDKRVYMMQYQKWIEQDLVIASGQVEGAVRHVVGERLDCSGMRWTIGKAEPLLHLRCIELNGDWERFFDWCQQRHREELRGGGTVRVLTNRPVKLAKVA